MLMAKLGRTIWVAGDPMKGKHTTCCTTALATNSAAVRLLLKVTKATELANKKPILYFVVVANGSVELLHSCCRETYIFLGSRPQQTSTSLYPHQILRTRHPATAVTQTLRPAYTGNTILQATDFKLLGTVQKRESL